MTSNGALAGENRIRRSQQAAREHLLSAIEAVDRVIEANRRLAEWPEHRDSAERRISEGEDELVRLEQELAVLEATIGSAELEPRS